MTRSTFKQPVVASRAVVTTNHPEASAAALQALAMGGNAVDATVAALFSLSVVEPMMVCPHGAGFFVIRDGPTGAVHTIDNYATVPLAAKPDCYRPIPGSTELETEDAENDIGYRAAATPGALAGWCAAVERFGRLPLAELIAPAIAQARRGFVVSDFLHHHISLEWDALGRFPASAAVFLPGGEPAQPGTRLVRGDYADTLERMARNAVRELVDGETAHAVAADMAANGGMIGLEDGRHYRLHDREPIRAGYRGYEVVAMGPVSSGGVHIAQMLRILEGFDLRATGFGTVESVHLLAEVMKIAFADRFRYLGDPATVDVPIDWLVSEEYARERRTQIASGNGMAATVTHGRPFAESAHTTHVNAIDADGTMVSATQTLNSAFGSRVTVPGTGMLLNNCMRLMDPVPGRTNSIAPGKRILSSMSPTLVLRDSQPWLAIGTPGGIRIFPSVMQAIVNLIDHGMTPQEAVEAPRVWTKGLAVEVEDTFDDLPALVAGLERRGHRVEVVPKIAGGMGAIRVDSLTGLMEGATCWRADGAPAGLSGGPARPVDESRSR